MKYTRGKNGMYAGDVKVVSVLKTDMHFFFWVVSLSVNMPYTNVGE
jgi:hypothetical protein